MTFSKEDIFRIATEQSAVDCGCSASAFTQQQNVTVSSRKTEGARVYLDQPLACNLVSYGTNVVAVVRDDLRDTVHRFIESHPTVRCFETPALHELDDALAPFGVRSRYMAEYFLPDAEKLRELPCGYPVKILHPEEFRNLYLPEWSSALCADRAQYDVLCAGAYDGDRLVGLAGVSADCASMWQIGINVLPAYRMRGIAAALTSRLALEVFARGKVPFYCAAWSNIRSVRTAIKCGFYPAWVELTCFETENV